MEGRDVLHSSIGRSPSRLDLAAMLDVGPADAVPSDSVLSLAGVRIRREHALDLARRLARDGSDSTARLLLDAVTHGHDVAALSHDDRTRILAVLDHPPRGLVELRAALFDELNWRGSATGGT